MVLLNQIITKPYIYIYTLLSDFVGPSFPTKNQSVTKTQCSAPKSALTWFLNCNWGRSTVIIGISSSMNLQVDHFSVEASGEAGCPVHGAVL